MRQVGRLRLVLLATAALSASVAGAAQVGQVAVDRHGDRFDIRMEMTVDAPPSLVFKALEDYRSLPEYNPEVKFVQVVPTGTPGRVVLYSVVQSCVLFFCKTLRQHQLMTAVATADGGTLDVEFLPGGDFKEGVAHWLVSHCVRGAAPTCVTAALHLQTNFWVPPLIGSWIVRRKMENEARVTGDGLQELALKLER